MLALRLNVVDKDMGLDATMKRAAELAKGAYVKVGVVGDGKPRTPAPGASHEAPDNLQVGLWMEFGTADGHVPERSFMRSTFDAKVSAWRDETQKLAGEIVDGTTTPKRALGLLGLRMEADVKNRILAGIAPANAPATIAAKGSSKPLIDTGQLLAAIVSAVFEGEGKGESE